MPVKPLPHVLRVGVLRVQVRVSRTRHVSQSSHMTWHAHQQSNIGGFYNFNHQHQEPTQHHNANADNDNDSQLQQTRLETPGVCVFISFLLQTNCLLTQYQYNYNINNHNDLQNVTTPGTTNDHHRLTTTEYEAGAANQVTTSDNSATAMSQPLIR